ncbi:hypothetical protein VP1G_11369 [Cytospora mali]|uniref:Uncharacterized protein n=1 Tax=Cytospora mali TaxID=578113 RepID=A0A194VD59_CYTMA|nr:hypothetical protein VP1G_11369 [Valsa mali var. pyri (nom. inval.)]
MHHQHLVVVLGYLLLRSLTQKDPEAAIETTALSDPPSMPKPPFSSKPSATPVSRILALAEYLVVAIHAKADATGREEPNQEGGPPTGGLRRGKKTRLGRVVWYLAVALTAREDGPLATASTSALDEVAMAAIRAIGVLKKVGVSGTSLAAELVQVASGCPPGIKNT